MTETIPSLFDVRLAQLSPGPSTVRPLTPFRSCLLSTWEQTSPEKLPHLRDPNLPRVPGPM